MTGGDAAELDDDVGPEVQLEQRAHRARVRRACARRAQVLQQVLQEGGTDQRQQAGVVSPCVWRNVTTHVR